MLKKKIIIPIIIALVVVAGSVGGVVLAESGSSGTATTTTTTRVNPQDTLMTKVASILGIDKTKLEDAFTQAQKEIQTEQLDRQLGALVSAGKITQDQADAYKSWHNSKPDDTAYQTALQNWLNSNPLAGTGVRLPGMGGPGGPGMMGGPGGPPGFGPPPGGPPLDDLGPPPGQ